MSLYLGSGNKVVKRTRLRDHVVTTVYYPVDGRFETWALPPGEEDDDLIGGSIDRSRALALHAQTVRTIRHSRLEVFRSDHLVRRR